SYFVTEDYLLREGQLGNFIFEIEPEIQRLDLILEYLYTLDERVALLECDFSALSDITPDGLILDHRAPLEEWVRALEGWFNFDIVPRGGKITAVKRGGSVVTRLYERELRAHLAGEERPRAAVKITHEDPIDLPGSVDVIYLDPSPSKDFHTGNQTAQKQVGHSFDPETLAFPIVGDANTAQAVGQRYLDARHLAAKPGQMVCGFGKRHLIPTDVIEVEMESGTLHTYRIVQKQADLQSLVRFSVVPERASIYSQGGAGVRGRGGDVLLVGPPANTLVVVADSLPVRQVDVGRLVLIAAGCPRGRGSWPGYHLNKRDQNGELERVGGFQAAATIGVVEAASQSAAGFGFEPTREFVVKLYYGTLESRTESEVRAERLNLALYGRGSVWEVLQFLSVEAQTPSEPFVAQYKVTGVISGLYGTEWASVAHQANDYFVLVDGALESFPMRPADITLPFDFIAQTAGQAVADAEAAGTSSLTFQGNSMKPLAVARVLLDETTQLAPRDSTGAILTTVEPRTNVETIGDEYLIQYLTDDRSQVLHEQEFGEGLPTPAVLHAQVEGFVGKFTSISGGNTFSLSGALGSGRATALQQIAGQGAFVEAELRAFGSTVTLGLIAAGKDWRTATPDFSIVLSGDGLASLECFEGST
ncbi:MAG TPA: phage tail protein, partial [Pyrinomonadaceae bacterium]|nr:phage tail protein [Pyrinomonadaceae bacterium]